MTCLLCKEIVLPASPVGVFGSIANNGSALKQIGILQHMEARHPQEHAATVQCMSLICFWLNARNFALDDDQKPEIRSFTASIEQIVSKMKEHCPEPEEPPAPGAPVIFG